MKRAPLEIKEIKDEEITSTIFIQNPLETNINEDNIKNNVNKFLNLSMVAGFIFTILAALAAFTAHNYFYQDNIVEPNETLTVLNPSKIVPIDSSLEGMPDNQVVFQKTNSHINEEKIEPEVLNNTNNIKLNELKQTFFKEILETKKIADKAIEENKNK